MSRFRRTQSDREPLKLKFRKGNTICNICRLKKNLTDDHVPPQSCGNNKPVVARRMHAAEMAGRQVDARSNNGLKFKTLCRECNGLVGGWDDALGQFAKEVRRIVESELTLPDTVTLTGVRAGAVVRSVLGHIVAAKVEDDDVPLDRMINDYLLKKSDLNAHIKVYCWAYPAKTTIVSRDYATADIYADSRQQAGPGLLSVIKFYPLAFCIVDGDGELDVEGATPLHQFAALDATVETDVGFRLRPVIHPAWPEKPMLDHLVIGGRMYMDSIVASSSNVLSVKI